MSLIYPNGYTDPVSVIPPRLIEDLALDNLAQFISFDNYFRLKSETLCKFFTCSEDVIAYRQAAIQDLLENENLQTLCQELLETVDVWRDHTVTNLSERMDGPLNLSELSYLDGFIRSVNSLSKKAAEINPKSKAFRSLIEQITHMSDGDRFKRVTENFPKLANGYVFPARMTLGFNLNSELRPTEVKLLAIEQKSTNKKKAPIADQSALMSSMLLSEAISRTSNNISGYIRREVSGLLNLRDELIFLLSAVQLCTRLKERKLDYCFPRSQPPEKKIFTADGLYNPLLAVWEKTGIVSSDISFLPDGEILILTGANQGGKTTFLQSVGLCQWMYQIGYPVAARSAELSPCENIVTVFASRNTEVSRRGLLAEELQRIALAVSETGQDSLVLLNEPLNSTSPAENLRISRQVIAVLAAARVRGVWVTHLYELASCRDEYSPVGGSEMGSARVTVEQHGGHIDPSYRVVRGEPDFKSYAAEVLRRKQLQI